MKIDEIADFPALQQLARALWGEGAAVLIGAGFSRNAERSGEDTPEPPLWEDISRDLHARLHPDDPYGDPGDPLKVAEEFRNYFGQRALDEYVRTRICDSAWQPGALHKAVLELPWSDVLTTNWDTLLENAARFVNEFHYQPVLFPRDLAHARAPRIIKLHGSVGTTERFIIAEEDYRTYPREFAAFVNCARQVFIENELCLIGFSGNDPNFIQWSGWVRDNLGDSSRRIYLVGYFNFTASRRKYLEARNVVPIDFSPLVNQLEPKDAHTEALKIFLKFLVQSKPVPAQDWKPADFSRYSFAKQTTEEWDRQFKDDDYAASLLDEAAKIWRSDRESYPGWLICPGELRQELATALSQVLIKKACLEKLPPGRAAEVLYERLWRSNVAHRPVEPQLMDILQEIADPESPQGIPKSQQLEVAVALLRMARKNNSDEEFDRWVTAIEKHATPGTNEYAECVYQRALRARDSLDFFAVEKLQEIIRGADPIWRIRRASFLFELGRFGEGERLINEALEDLSKRQREDRKSFWILSRRAWAEWLARALRSDRAQPQQRWPLEFKGARCDPRDELYSIAEQAAEQLRKRQEQAEKVVPLFEAGYYKDPSRETHLTFSAVPEPLDNLIMLTELVGLPRRSRHFDLMGQAGRDTIELAFSPNIEFYLWFLRTSDNINTKTFARYFGRIAIAQLADELTIEIRRHSLAALGYWRSRIKRLSEDGIESSLFAVERLRLLSEALARLAVRQSPLLAIETFSLAMEIGRDPLLRHAWLFESVNNLAKFSVEAVPTWDRQKLCLSMLEFPLSSEAGIQHPFDQQWPNPVMPLYNTAPSRGENEPAWRKRIHELIKASVGQRADRREASLRLWYLCKRGVLTEAESQEFAEALWSEKDPHEPSLPANTGLPLSAFAELPCPEGINTKERVNTRVFDVSIRQLLAPDSSSGMVDAVRPLSVLDAMVRAGQDGIVSPTPEQAVRLFDELVAWPSYTLRSKHSELPILSGYFGQLNGRLTDLMGEALARCIVPSMSISDLTENRASALIRLIEQTKAFSALEALPYFATPKQTASPEIIETVRRAVSSADFQEVGSGLLAIGKWAEAGEAQDLQRVPDELVRQVMAAIATRQAAGLAALLYCCLRLVEQRKLGTSDLTLLYHRLDELFTETAYERVEPDSRTAVSVSLIRANCVRLARSLKNYGSTERAVLAWLDAAEHDPLPEVRFA